LIKRSGLKHHIRVGSLIPEVTTENQLVSGSQGEQIISDGCAVNVGGVFIFLAAAGRQQKQSTGKQ
jgi:hypothetical protein